MRLKTTEIALTRIRLLAEQRGLCELCRTPLNPKDACLDHDHNTGFVRGVLHRGCNSLLGKLENNAARYGVRDIGVFSNGVAQYLRMHLTSITGLLHPSHRTAEERRVARNTKARKTRAKHRDTNES